MGFHLLDDTVAPGAAGPSGRSDPVPGDKNGMGAPFLCSILSAKYFDADSKLYYYGYRYYCPGMGRWISRDPIEEAGGVNLYVLVGNNPITDVDILGREVDDEWLYKTPLSSDRRHEYIKALDALIQKGSISAHDALTALEGYFSFIYNDPCPQICCTKENLQKIGNRIKQVTAQIDSLKISMERIKQMQAKGDAKKELDEAIKRSTGQSSTWWGTIGLVGGSVHIQVNTKVINNICLETCVYKKEHTTLDLYRSLLPRFKADFEQQKSSNPNLRGIEFSDVFGWQVFTQDGDKYANLYIELYGFVNGELPCLRNMVDTCAERAKR